MSLFEPHRDAGSSETIETLGQRFFSASISALISECGTAISFRMNSVNVAESPRTFLAESVGGFGIG